MRKKIFRAKGKEDPHNWHYGDLLTVADSNDRAFICKWINPDIEAPIRQEFIEVIPETVGEYTGLDVTCSDLEKKPFNPQIFEGDILDVTFGSYGEAKHVNVEVFWDVKTLQWRVRGGNLKVDNCSLTSYWKPTYKVIGNIHDKKGKS